MEHLSLEDIPDESKVCSYKARYIYGTNIRNGELLKWYPGGRLKEESHFIQNRRHGTSKKWHPNGQLWKKVIYNMDQPIYIEEYDEEGTLLYINGVENN